MAIARRMHTLGEEQIASFWENGFVVIEDVTTEAQREHIKNTLADLMKRPAEKRTKDFNVDFNSETALRNINHFTRYWIAGSELIRNPRSLGAVRDILGDDVRFHHTKIMLKRAHEGTIISWHQDLASYVGDEQMERLTALGPALTARDVPFVAVQHYLDDASEQNGCLCFIARSHNWGLRPVDKSPAGRESRAREDLFAGERIVKVPVKAGNAVAFHSLVYHYSGPNNSPIPRRAPIVQYFSPPTRFSEAWYNRETNDTPFGERLVAE